MTLETFHVFHKLPFDIRREIYMLATPPHVVHVQEQSQDEEEFKDSLRTKVNLQLNPDLVYFAPNWRRVIKPESNKQPTLESFGLNTRKGPPQPWEPSASTPEIPLSWLEKNPKYAWHFMRDNFLYSTAPIPSLLHACFESRGVLRRWGYQLAFRTRTNGPQTWFHFDRDVLLVDKTDWRERMHEEVGDCLVPHPWNIIGQFHSQDLKRVRRLALGKSGHTLFPWKRYGQSRTDLYHAIQLFPNLREVQIVQWSTEDLFRWRNFGVNGSKSGKHPWYSYTVKEAPCEPNGALCCVYAEEIDGLFSLLTHLEGLRDHLPATGFMGEILRLHKQQIDNKLDFFAFQQTQLEQRLRVLRAVLEKARVKEEGPDLSSFTWKIPTVRAVHMILPSMVQLLVNERRLVWEKLYKLKQNYRALGDHSTIDDGLPLNALLTDGLGGGIDDSGDSDEFHDVGLGPFGQMHLFGNRDDICFQRAKRWWAEDENGVLAEPGLGEFFPDWVLTYPDGSRSGILSG